VTNKDEDYVADCRILIDETALDPIHRIPTDRDLETEIANAIIDGCVAELRGIPLDNITHECRHRLLAVIAVASGFRTSYGGLPLADRH
jgi:hypothetical protein